MEQTMESDTDNTAAETQAPAWIDVVVLGGDTQQLDFTPGMTVGQAIASAGLTVRRGNVLQVNGRPANNDTVLEPGSVLQLTSRVTNG